MIKRLVRRSPSPHRFVVESLFVFVFFKSISEDKHVFSACVHNIASCNQLLSPLQPNKRPSSSSKAERSKKVDVRSVKSASNPMRKHTDELFAKEEHYR